MKNIVNWAIHLCVSSLLLGCTSNYADYNTDPYGVSQGMLNQDNLQVGGFIVQMQKNVVPAGNNATVEVNQYQLTDNLQGDIYSGYMGVSNNWNGGQNNSNYALIPGWYGAMFDQMFSGAMSAWGEIQAKETTADVIALSNILKVAALHRATDTYGPLPYLNFKLGTVNTQYDSQEEIYNSFFEDLDEAVKVLTDFVNINPNAKPLKAYDLVYEGDYRRWVQFANSLKLRLALRVVYAVPSLAQEQAESAVNHPFGVIATNQSNAFFKSSTAVVIRNPISVICFNYDDIRMGANMESFLKGYNDPRLPLWFNEANLGGETGYYGIRNGISITNKSDYTPFSTLKIDEQTPMVWMVAAESAFARAEGALRGWNMGGTAQKFYEEGVQLSFEQVGAGAASAYLNNGTDTAAPYSDFANGGNNVGTGDSSLSTITIKWEESAGFELKLERILTQKWIAMFPNGQEAWSEFRRTRYPKIFPVVVNNSGGEIDTEEQIRRMPFPEREYQNNPQGVNTGLSLLGGADTGGTKLWWDKKNK